MGARDKLSDKAIKAAKPRAGEYKMSDGRGLYLVVPTKKAKWFRFDSRFAGKQLTLSVGRYGEKKSDTTLATFMAAIRDVGTDAVDAALGRSHRRNARLKYRINGGGVTPALAASIGEEALELAKLLARGLSMTR